jgi:hypothetical protein
MGALFSIYFYANVLNDHESISGCLLRFDWLFCIVAAVCLLKKERYASSAFFLTLSAMIRLFPAALFVGLAVSFFQKVRLARAVDGKIKRFIVAAGATALLLFLLPAASLGSLRPWNDFFSKMELHDSGVYVNHVGLRGIVLFEPSHLSLERFVETYTSPNHSDLVRHWQEVKQMELRDKRFITTFFSLVVLGCVVAIIWKRKEGASESVIWPVLLIYVMSYPSAYYYIFLCLFVLLFFGRADPLGAFVPLGLLLVFNITALVTKYFEPSPIVFYTLVNIYLFICLLSILCFEMYTNVFRKTPLEAAAVPYPPHEPSRGVKRRRRQGRASRK